jgi:transcriptional regulator with XRE-family HTH domain
MNREELIQQGVIDAFATFVIDRRKALGMTQEDLATAAGLGIATIKRFESRKFMPDGKNLLKIASALNCYLFMTPRDADDPDAKAMRERWRRPYDQN